MGNLSDFIEYLDGRIGLIGQVEQRLCKLQEKYETFFAEVTAVREAELAQLTEHILSDRSKLPDRFNEALDRTEAQVEQELAEKLAALEQQRERCLAQAEKARQASREQERAMHGKNVELDRQEEALKARSEKLLAAVADHNDRIRQLGRGFGFFANFFQMRRLNRERAALDREQTDIAAHIERLRLQWTASEAPYAKKERELQQAWVQHETEAAALQTKIDYLAEARPRIVLRSTVERVLYELGEEPPAPAKGDPPCPRCKGPNPATSHFCAICAQRLQQDRPDLEGSIREIAEVNLHHRRFSEGMQASQGIIGLVRGLRSGLEAFLESVSDVRRTEGKYNLSTLEINVPDGSLQWGKQFDELARAVERDLSLHPKAFAEQVDRLTKQVFTEQQIKDYFESMGNELSTRAHAQWD